MSNNEEKTGSTPLGRGPAKTEIEITTADIPGMGDDETVFVFTGYGDSSFDEFKEALKASRQY